MPANSQDERPGLYPSLQISRGSPTSFIPPQPTAPQVPHNPLQPGWNSINYTQPTPPSFLPPNNMTNGKRPSAATQISVTGSDVEIIGGMRRTKVRGWKDLSSREKHLIVALAIAVVTAVTFIAILIGEQVNGDDNEEYLLPTTPRTTTDLPPWLTYAPPNTTTTTTTTTRTTTTTTTTKPPGWNTCLESDCALVAGRMLNSMTLDSAVDPCEDFYTYACGGWLYSNSVPEYTGVWDTVSEANGELQRRIRLILENDVTDEDSDDVKAAQFFYESCKDAENADYTSHFETWLGSLNINAGDATSLGSSLGLIRKKLGQDFIFSTVVDVDELAPENYTIYIVQPELGLARPFLLEESHPFVAAYSTLISEAVQTVFQFDEATAAVVAESVVRMETRLANISAEPMDMENRTEMYNPITVDELGESLTFISWPSYFEDLLSEAEFFPEVVVVENVEFMEQLETVISEFTAEEIENFLKWRITFALAKDISPDMRKLVQDFASVTQGASWSAPRWKVCAEQTNSLLGMAVAYKYIRKHFSEDYKEQISQVITNVKEALTDSIGESNWVPAEVAAALTNKIENLNSLIAHPEWLSVPVESPENSTAEVGDYNLTTFYEDLFLDENGNYLSHVLDILEWRSGQSLTLLNRTASRYTWTKDVVLPNAFYSTRYNALIYKILSVNYGRTPLPAGIIQPPFYGLPLRYLNYAAIGFKIGHEIAHSLDPRGIQYGWDGSLSSYWDEDSLGNYAERVSCYLDQYRNYTVDELDMKLNRSSTLKEDIADNVGLDLAWKAYQKSGTTAEKILPGFDALGFTVDQIFFIAYAQNFCGMYTPQALEEQVRAKPHSPFKIRVAGTLENSPDFNSAFQCERSSEQSQCSLWSAS